MTRPGTLIVHSNVPGHVGDMQALVPVWFDWDADAQDRRRVGVYIGSTRVGALDRKSSESFAAVMKAAEERGGKPRSMSPLARARHWTRLTSSLWICRRGIPLSHPNVPAPDEKGCGEVGSMAGRRPALDLRRSRRDMVVAWARVRECPLSRQPRVRLRSISDRSR